MPRRPAAKIHVSDHWDYFRDRALMTMEEPPDARELQLAELAFKMGAHGMVGLLDVVYRQGDDADMARVMKLLAAESDEYFARHPRVH